MDKIIILLEEGNLMHCPEAYIEVYNEYLLGGVGARGGGYHIPPKMGYRTTPSYNMTIRRENIEDIKKALDVLFPESDYKREYVL